MPRITQQTYHVWELDDLEDQTVRRALLLLVNQERDPIAADMLGVELPPGEAPPTVPGNGHFVSEPPSPVTAAPRRGRRTKSEPAAQLTPEQKERAKAEAAKLQGWTGAGPAPLASVEGFE